MQEKYIIEDIRTVHAEIKQIINLRQNNIAIAITILALFITSLTQIDKLNLEWLFLEPAYFLGWLFVFILLLLHTHSRILTKQLFTLSLFLTSQNFSLYESLWSKFPRSKISGYSFYQKIFFIAIGTLILFICFIFTYSEERIFCGKNLLTFILSTLIYIFLIELISKLVLNKKILKRIENKWKTIIK